MTSRDRMVDPDRKPGRKADESGPEVMHSRKADGAGQEVRQAERLR